MQSWAEGVAEVSEATVILLLAWSLGGVVGRLQTASFLASAIGSWLPPALLPFVSLLLSMLVSFGIGTAWGTMGVLVPLVAPLAWDLSGRDLGVLTACLGAVMGGACFGNVSSPLADTSVLAAMICKCEMLAHVSSQATYTTLTAVLSLLLGALPVGLGVYPIWVALLLSIVILAAAPLLADGFATGRPRRWLRLPRRVSARRSHKPIPAEEQLLGGVANEPSGPERLAG